MIYHQIETFFRTSKNTNNFTIKAQNIQKQRMEKNIENIAFLLCCMFIAPCSIKNCYDARKSYPKTSCFAHKSKGPRLIKKRRRIIMKTNHLADWRWKRWRDVMWFHLTHTRYSRESFETIDQTQNKQQSDESKVHERDEIYFYFCMFVDCLSLWQRRLLFHFSLLRVACVDVFHCYIEFRMRTKMWKHRLPQHQH